MGDIAALEAHIKQVALIKNLPYEAARKAVIEEERQVLYVPRRRYIRCAYCEVFSPYGEEHLEDCPVTLSKSINELKEQIAELKELLKANNV